MKVVNPDSGASYINVEMKRVRLAEIAEAIGAETSGGTWYLDTESGTTEFIADNVMDAILERADLSLDDIPADVRLQLNLAREVVADNDARFIKLPGQFDVLEWDVMRRFALQQADPAVASDFFESLQGATAFQAFQLRVRKYKVQREWNLFREAVMRDVALEWCTQHDIPFEV